MQHKTSNVKSKILIGHKNAESYLLLLSKPNDETEAKEQHTEVQEVQGK